MDDWVAELQAGKPESAWDRFLDRYRRLIFSAIRHYAQDYDDVMDIFARVCEALRADDLRRLRCYVDQPRSPRPFLHVARHRRPAPHGRLVPPPRRPPPPLDRSRA